jgi:hypothetical protein
MRVIHVILAAMPMSVTLIGCVVAEGPYHHNEDPHCYDHDSGGYHGEYHRCWNCC